MVSLIDYCLLIELDRECVLLIITECIGTSDKFESEFVDTVSDSNEPAEIRAALVELLDNTAMSDYSEKVLGWFDGLTPDDLEYDQTFDINNGTGSDTVPRFDRYELLCQSTSELVA